MSDIETIKDNLMMKPSEAKATLRQFITDGTILSDSSLREACTLAQRLFDEKGYAVGFNDGYDLAFDHQQQGRIDAEERTKLVAATYQAQQQSYRELEAVYSACVEDKQRAEAENADLREKLQKVLADAVRPFPRQRK